MAGTPIDCSCLICSVIAENNEVVAVEDFIDVDNILGKFWVSFVNRMPFLVFLLHCRLEMKSQEVIKL